jgi:hypothetical protein
MQGLPRTTDLLAGLVVMLLLTGGHALAVSSGQSSSALTADEAIACIRAAVAAQAGAVKELEATTRRGNVSVR